MKKFIDNEENHQLTPFTKLKSSKAKGDKTRQRRLARQRKRTY